MKKKSKYLAYADFLCHGRKSEIYQHYARLLPDETRLMALLRKAVRIIQHFVIRPFVNADDDVVLLSSIANLNAAHLARFLSDPKCCCGLGFDAFYRLVLELDIPDPLPAEPLPLFVSGVTAVVDEMTRAQHGKLLRRVKPTAFALAILFEAMWNDAQLRGWFIEAATGDSFNEVSLARQIDLGAAALTAAKREVPDDAQEIALGYLGPQPDPVDVFQRICEFWLNSGPAYLISSRERLDEWRPPGTHGELS